MAASIDDYLETYQQACTAYAQQKYDVAATLVDEVVQNVPDDPNSHLLRGHIYYVLQQYDVAQAEYQNVLHLTDDREIIDQANNGIQNIKQYQQLLDNQDDQQINFTSTSDSLESDEIELLDLGAIDNFDHNSFDLSSFENSQGTNDVKEVSLDNPFEVSPDSVVGNQTSDSTTSFSDDPFAVDQQTNEQDLRTNSLDGELDLPVFWQEEISEESLDQPQVNTSFLDSEANYPILKNSIDSPFAEANVSKNSNLEITSELLLEEDNQDLSIPGLELFTNNPEGETVLMGKEALNHGSTPTNNLKNNSENNVFEPEAGSWLKQIEAEDKLPATPVSFNGSFSPKDQPSSGSPKADINNFDADESFDFEAFESAFGSDSATIDDEPNSIPNRDNSKSNIEFLDDFDEFDDLGNIPGFDISDADSSFSDVAMISSSMEIGGSPRSQFTDDNSHNAASDRDEELFTITGSQEAVPVFTQTDISKLEPNVSVEQGLFAPLENAPLDAKPWLVAGAVGIVSAVVVATVSFASTSFSPPQQRESVRNTGWAMSAAAGIAGFATAAFMGNLTLKQVRRTTKDLQAQFDSVRQGNLNAQATVYSQDELGLLASGFNEMARVIFTTTNEAQRKADEQEEAKENLQRQVIRLLDDVEGAARGDLTVQAEVTADVLGAVADAFNLTIQNLRDIVQQVKVAAKEVTKGATNSETFARALSSDALRQAEELAVTLNSVQVMTDSIQRVAEAAREAEAVARDASTIALKGGEAVENTVAGILEIRETVAETTRKVKRLAESSQEISKIVALISQIASRTNLLALNASIEAARAGEAGRGFAIVADEVRQLADKSAKSLKEIEQIVMQIQSETGSVMTAMEEGTQQVIKGTKLAEEAKRSLENIIQVANRIDILVRSITSDTVEQTETSRAVAGVMQSVELTAQETSQEAQRVSGALQNLVGVSRDLIASVERFRVETIETK